MSERRVGTRPGDGALRVRPPHPLSPPVRLVAGAMVLVVLAIGGVILRSAADEDRALGPATSELDRPQTPRGSELDRFDVDGVIGTDRALAWTAAAGAWTVRDGSATSSAATEDLALVATGHRALLIDTLVVRARPGSGIVLADGPGDRLALVVDPQGSGWQLVRTVDGTPAIVQLVPGPVVDTVLQVLRRGSEIRVSFDRDARTIELPGAAPTGESIGLVATGAGTAFGRFAYLPLDDR